MALRLLRKLHKTGAMAGTAKAVDHPLFIAHFLMCFLRVAMLLAIWRVLFAGRGTLSGMTLGMVLTYTLISEVFGAQLSCRTGLEGALWDGSIATRFIRPIGIFQQFAAEMVGGWWLSFSLISIPLLCLAPLLGVNPLPASLTAGGFFVVSLILAILLGLAVDLIFGALMVHLEQDYYTTNIMRGAVQTLLSGSLLPLALYPWGIGRIFDWLPFASMASAPLRIYTGTGDPLPLMALQAGWCIVLWPVMLWLWRANRERLVCHGG